MPEIKPVRVSSVADLDQRVLGENAYSRRSAEERLAEIIAKDLADLTDSIVRRIEKMASDLLLNGKIDYVLDDGTVESAGLRDDYANGTNRRNGMRLAATLLPIWRPPATRSSRTAGCCRTWRSWARAWSARFSRTQKFRGN